MLLESIEYTRPESIDEALKVLESNDGAAALAGGQSLSNVLKNRVASVDLLVDITRLEELHGIEVTDDSINIGACVTYDEIDNSAEIRGAMPILSEVAHHLEDQQIRDRGTIGGNCCLSDPTNNFPPIVIALDATMHVQSSSGVRDIPADEFFQGYFMTAIQPGEILRSISIPRFGSGTGAGYNTLSIATDAKAIVRAAARVSANGSIEDARVVLAVVGPVPIRHTAMEEALNGQPATPETVDAAAETIGDDLDPPTDAHGTSEYRRKMARVVARRAVNQAIATAGDSNQ